MTAGDIRPNGRGGRAARRANDRQREQERLEAYSVISNRQTRGEIAQAEAVNCPICRTPIHPTNWSKHMEQKHPDQQTPIHEAEPGYLALTAIRIDGGTQPRAQTEDDVVADYADAMREGTSFPKVIVFYDGQDYWLADGFHRVAAAKMAGLTEIAANVRQGTQRDAILFSVGANADHGLRRTNADKQRAVMRLLSDDEWAKWSNREIARRCLVSESLVRSLREKRSDDDAVRTYTTKHGTTTTMQTGNIGKPASNGAPSSLVERLGGIGATVQARSGQTGTLQSIMGRIAYVETPNGVKEYDALYLWRADAPTPTEHWGLSSDMAFWMQVGKFNLDRNTILAQMQADATVLTDLRMTRDDAWVKLNQIATERTTNLFPIDSYVKREDGNFGQVKQAHAVLIRVYDLTFKSEGTWSIDKCRPTTEAEYLASLSVKDPEPAEIPSYADLPERQVEFLVDLAYGRPIKKNAATRMALRGHALITLDNDWSAITLTNEGELWLGVRNLLPKSYNYKRDSKVTRPETPDVSQPYDRMQTPPYALDPLLPHLYNLRRVWEPAAGEGLLVEALFDSGFESVISSDILTGQNFLDYEPDEDWDCIITNPPYSLKFPWLERCYALGKPFALLLPGETLFTQTAQELFRKYGVEIICMDKRVNFKMPNKGWDGGGAQFATAWFTWGLGIGSQITFARIKPDDDPE